MHIILIILGLFITYYAVSKYLTKQPEQFNNIFHKVLAVIFAVVGFLMLIRGQIPVAVVAGTAAVLSWQGTLWNYLRSKAGGPGVDSEKGTASINTMDRGEALEILELSGAPSEEEIKAAHHRLMKKIHPDQGGSGYFAAKLNQAKDLLLNQS